MLLVMLYNTTIAALEQTIIYQSST